MLRSVLIFASLALATTGALLFGCEGPESFQLAGDAGSILTPHDAGDGTGGSQVGTGGAIAPGTGGTIAPGTGGMGGAIAAGGRDGSSNAGGQNGTAGSPASSGGVIGSAGGGNGGSVAASGGMLGNGGGPASTGGMVASGGAAGSGSGGNVGGSMGMAGRGGMVGSSGGAGSSGSGGAAGAGGAAGGTGPCAGVCASPMKTNAQNFNSGGVGLGAACFETTYNIQGGTCFNFAGRTLKLNGTTESCAGANWPTPLPAKKNGGYCIDISAGSNASAGFQTF